MKKFGLIIFNDEPKLFEKRGNNTIAIKIFVFGFSKKIS